MQSRACIPSYVWFLLTEFHFLLRVELGCLVCFQVQVFLFFFWSFESCVFCLFLSATSWEICGEGCCWSLFWRVCGDQEESIRQILEENNWPSGAFFQRAFQRISHSQGKPVTCKPSLWHEQQNRRLCNLFWNKSKESLIKLYLWGSACPRRPGLFGGPLMLHLYYNSAGLLC